MSKTFHSMFHLDTNVITIDRNLMAAYVRFVIKQ